jgi:hypothetical protein
MNRKLSLLLLLVLTAASVSAAGPEPKYKAPRTADGQPDLQGVWNFTSGVPLQRSPAFADKKFFTKEEFDKQRAAIAGAFRAIGTFAPVENVGLDWMDNALHVDDLRTSLITYPENGRLPPLVDGVVRMPGVEDFLAALSDPKGASSQNLISLLATFGGGKKDSHTDLGVSDRCLSSASVPIVPGLGDNYMQILQSKDSVALLTDEHRRIIALDAKAQVGDRLRSWSGVSRGHWERETLVVETRNFNNRMSSFGGAGRSRDKVVTERFTRTSKGGLEYAASVVDPKTFQDRLELSFPMARVEARLYESTCHEGNYSLANILSAARAEEREAAKTAATK